jgi:hypothetical protein
MSFIESLVDRPFSNDDIIDTCAMLLDISATSITVVEDIAAWQADPRVALVCEVTAVRGGFALRVGLYACEPALDERLDELFVKQFAQRLDRACLVSDASPNPFAWIVINDPNLRRSVFFDPEQLDADAYVVAQPG